MGGKWKGLILFWLGEEEHLRFGELRRTVAGISERMLTLQLRELEAAGLVHREVHEQVPPKVEYSLTDFGRSLVAALMPLGEVGRGALGAPRRPAVTGYGRRSDALVLSLRDRRRRACSPTSSAGCATSLRERG
ncbi:winged helix-turn-helix transcriptional regulator [Streptomyces anulatus]|nr:winged helix-turn-helix transcriptional regulator [Streptomyces anulatus]